MKRKFFTILLAMAVVFSLGMPAAATTYTGTLTSNVGGGLTSIGSQWGTTESFKWTINNETNVGFWTYVYTFETTSNKKMAYIDVGVGPGFDSSKINTTFTTTGYSGPKTFTETTGTKSIFGLQWDPTDIKKYTVTLVSPNAPMWGDFYARGETNTNNYNINSGFGETVRPTSTNFISANAANSNGKFSIPIATPIPAAAWLLGTGLVGLVAIRRRRR